MNVYLAPQPGLSRAMDRVTAALIRFAPAGVRIVKKPAQADLEVLHVIGWPETEDRIVAAITGKRDYAMIQYCLRSTQRPLARDWVEAWQNAETVWSYYDLHALLLEDHWIADFDFYEAPLGIDDVFKQFYREPKPFVLGTSGFVADAECLLECADAVRNFNNHDRMFHVGHDLTLGAHVTTELNLDDAKLAKRWAQCEFVAGLRRVEGFELPVYEGLACGARPIVFDRPHYRDWLGGVARYVPETSDASVLTAAIEEVLCSDPRVTREEQQWAWETFDWKTIAEGFWARVR